MAFISYWWNNFLTGWGFGNSIIGILQIIFGVVVLFWWFKKGAKEDVKWEGKVLKLLTLLFVGITLFTTIFVAPYVKQTEVNDRADLAQASLSKNLSRPLRVISSNEDKEARAELGKTKEELKETQRLLVVATNEAEGLRLRFLAAHFVPLSKLNEAEFIRQFREFEHRWPSITNVNIHVDTTDKSRRLWSEQMSRIISVNKLPITPVYGIISDKGQYDAVMFFSPDCHPAREDAAKVFANLFTPPIFISTNPYPGQIIMRLLGSPTFGTNGVIRFD